MEPQRPAALLRIEPDEAVYGVVVGRQFHGLRIHQILPDHIRLVDWSKLVERSTHTRLVHNRDGKQVGLQGARRIQVVVNFLRGRIVGISVVQVQGADGCFDFVRDGDSGGNRGRHLVVLGETVVTDATSITVATTAANMANFFNSHLPGKC